MNKFLLVAIISLCINTIQAQIKVKGNRNPSTQVHQLEPFNIIDIGDDFEVILQAGDLAQIEITTDSNLHEYINISNQDSIISLSKTAQIRSKKEMTIKLTYPAGLIKLIAKDKAEISAITSLKFDQLSIELNDDAKLFLTASINELTINQTGKTKSELQLDGNQINIKLSDKSRIKTLLNYKSLNLTMQDRSNLHIEGNTNKAIVDLKDNSSLNGGELLIQDLALTTMHDTNADVNVSDHINIKANDNAKIKLYNNPKITIDTFQGSSQLIKK